MRWIIAVLLAAHGLVHLMGFAKAYGYAGLPQLTQPISRPMGLMWLAAALLVIASGVTMVAWPDGVWMVGALALVLSQAVIVSAWRDAWAGTVVNVVLLMAVAYGWLTEGPPSFRAQFERDVAVGVARPLDGMAVRGGRGGGPAGTQVGTGTVADAQEAAARTSSTASTKRGR